MAWRESVCVCIYVYTVYIYIYIHIDNLHIYIYTHSLSLLHMYLHVYKQARSPRNMGCDPWNHSGGEIRSTDTTAGEGLRAWNVAGLLGISTGIPWIFLLGISTGIFTGIHKNAWVFLVFEIFWSNSGTFFMTVPPWIPTLLVPLTDGCSHGVLLTNTVTKKGYNLIVSS